MAITLDLMELDGKATPEALASEVIRQNPGISAPISVEELAEAAGIIDIKPLTSEAFEGMLISNPEKSEGIVFVNQNRPRQRQRFTIGHEVGHFLLPWHRNILDGSLKFECTAEDMRASISGKDLRTDWEVQANQFSSEILMPRLLFKKYMKQKVEPDLAHVQDLSRMFDTSMEATALRYVALSEYRIAMIFAKGRMVRHAWRAPEFHFFLEAKKGSVLPKASQSTSDGADDSVVDFESIESYWWINEDRGPQPPDEILEQTLYQRDGYRIIMLYVDGKVDDE